MKTCLTCTYLGECKVATLEMLKNNEGCGSWDKEDPIIIRARKKAKELAGPIALKAMLINQPKKRERKGR